MLFHSKFSRNSPAAYEYDALGTKKRQIASYEGKPIKTTYFVSNFVIENNVPMYSLYDEGRIVYDKGLTISSVEVNMKDHLGNVRAVFDITTGQVKQTNAYYPFGMQNSSLSANTTTTTNVNEYKYNGKMFQDENGLNWYDYRARFYDAVVGRWWSVDPLSEQYRRWSPYNYCVDNPMRFVDPDGMQSKPATEKKVVGQAVYVSSYSTSVTNLEQGYSRLPNDTKRTINGLWNVVSGGAQFLGGAGVAIGSGTSLTGLGAIISMHGGYKVAEGVHQIANVITGTDSREDPKFSTPVGSITENKAVDVVTDLTIGSVTGNAGSLINSINYTSTMVTAIDGIKELTNQNQDKTDKVTYEKKNQNLEKTIHTPAKSYLMPL